MNLTEKQKECLAVIKTASLVNLSTIDSNGFPSTRAMRNLRNEEEFPSLIPIYTAEKNPLTVYFTTNTNSRKIQEIQQNPKASLYFFDETRFQGVLLQGKIELVKDQSMRAKVWQDEWKMYYPNGDEDYSLLRFTPAQLKTYANHTVSVESIAE